MTVRVNTALMKHDAARRGWSGTQLATKSKVSQMTVSRLFRGAPIKPATVEKLAKALGYTVDRYLLETPAVAS
jgi:transcriptional regulator with XRE-family HTH domain